MKYAYQVNPRIPIRGLKGQNAIIRPTVLDLEKEDVLFCLRFGNVYRRFSPDTLVKVTKTNIDEYHIPASEYKEEKKYAPNDSSVVSNINFSNRAMSFAAGPSEGKPINIVNKNLGAAGPSAHNPEPNKVDEGGSIEVPGSKEKVEEPVVEEKKEETPVVSEPEKVAEEEVKAVESDITTEENNVTDEIKNEPVEEKVEEIAPVVEDPAEEVNDSMPVKEKKEDGGTIEAPGSNNNNRNNYQKKKKH